jgi:hypothetical protein
MTAEERLSEIQTLLRIAIDTSDLLRDDCPICLQPGKSATSHLHVCPWPKLVEWADTARA